MELDLFLAEHDATRPHAVESEPAPASFEPPEKFVPRSETRPAISPMGGFSWMAVEKCLWSDDPAGGFVLMYHHSVGHFRYYVAQNMTTEWCMRWETPDGKAGIEGGPHHTRGEAIAATVEYIKQAVIIRGWCIVDLEEGVPA